MSLSQEWGWAVVVAAIPVIFFGALELKMWMARRRLQAVARRRKGPPGGSSRSAG